MNIVDDVFAVEDAKDLMAIDGLIHRVRISGMSLRLESEFNTFMETVDERCLLRLLLKWRDTLTHGPTDAESACAIDCLELLAMKTPSMHGREFHRFVDFGKWLPRSGVKFYFVALDVWVRIVVYTMLYNNDDVSSAAVVGSVVEYLVQEGFQCLALIDLVTCCSLQKYQFSYHMLERLFPAIQYTIKILNRAEVAYMIREQLWRDEPVPSALKNKILDLTNILSAEHKCYSIMNIVRNRILRLCPQPVV
jgi:hypothetical protein